MTIKRLILSLVILSVSCFAQWSEVQKAWNSTAGTSPATTTVSLTGVGANHVVVASVQFLGTATGFTVAVTDGNGHSFTQTPSSPCVYSAGEKVWLYYLLNSTSGNMTVTATPSIAHGLSVHAVEFIPVSGGVVKFDTDACATTSTGTTPLNTPSLTPTIGGLLYSGALSDPGSTGHISAAGASWTLGTNGTIASDVGQSGDEYQFNATGSTAVNYTVAASANTGWVAMAMSIIVINPPNVSLRGKVSLKGDTSLK